MYNQFDVILGALGVIETQATESQVKATASGYLKRLIEFDILFCLFNSLTLFELTDTLSKYLKRKIYQLEKENNLLNSQYRYWKLCIVRRNLVYYGEKLKIFVRNHEGKLQNFHAKQGFQFVIVMLDKMFGILQKNIILQSIFK